MILVVMTWGRHFQAEGQIADHWFFDVEVAPVIVEATRPPESDDETATALAAELDMVLETLVISP